MRAADYTSLAHESDKSLDLVFDLDELCITDQTGRHTPHPHEHDTEIQLLRRDVRRLTDDNKAIHARRNTMVADEMFNRSRATNAIHARMNKMVTDEILNRSRITAELRRLSPCLVQQNKQTTADDSTPVYNPRC